MNPTTLTPEEMNTARTLVSQGRKPDEVMGYIATQRLNAPSRIANERNWQPKQPSPGFLQQMGDVAGRTIADLPSDVMDLGRGVQGQVVQSGQNIKQAVTQEGLSLPQRAAGLTAEPVRFGLGMAGEAVTGVARFASTPELEQATVDKISKVGEQVMQSDIGQGVNDWYQSLPDDQKYMLSKVIAPTAELVAEVGTLGGIRGALSSIKKGFTNKTEAPSVEQVAPKLQEIVQQATEGNTAPLSRAVNATLPANERTEIVNNFAQSLQSSLVENRQSINRKLQEIATDRSRFGGTTISQDDLIRNLAEEGYIPDIRGKISDFGISTTDATRRQNEVMTKLNDLLDTVPVTTTVDDFYGAFRQKLQNDPRIGTDINTALTRIDALEQGAKSKYGDVLTARQINELKVEGNQKRGDMGTTDPFNADVWSVQAKAANEWLDSNLLDGLAKQSNREWARLQSLKETMEVLNNKPVDVGIMDRAIGAYVTTVMASGVGLSVAGPGGLVVAGILAKVGGDKVADMFRKKIFNPETAAKVREVMQKDSALLRNLEETATNQANKNFLNDLAGYKLGEQGQLPPAQPGSPRSQVSSGAPQAVGGQTPGGRVDVGGTERVREGAVRQPAQTGKLRQQAERFKSVDSFVKAVNNNPAWRKKFEEAGVTPEQIGKMVIGGGTALGLVYLLDNEELSGTGFMVMGSILGGAPARKTFTKQLAKKANEGDLLEMSQFTGALKEGAFKTNNKGELKVVSTKSFTQSEAQQALDSALRRAEDFPVVSNATLKELSDVFDDVLNQSGKAKGATPVSTSLDPKNFKTAEEGVLSQKAKGYNTTQELYKDKDFQALKERAEQLKTTAQERKDGTVIEWRKLQNQITEIENTVRQNQEQFRTAALKERDLEVRRNNPDVDVLDARATTLLQNEAKGKTLDEFIGLVRGSATQYGSYKPQMRRFVAPTAKRLSEIEGIDPNQIVTIYRGIDDQTGRVSVRINPGDFVTTSYDEALAYTNSPGKVAKLRVRARTLIEEYPDELDVETFMDSVSEFIYQPKDIVKITDTQLIDEWKKTNP